ncbi:hypothetical protein KJ918_07565, partial [Patescibacteria group bacterium]|nr:hypothetical protein [Patescibacteria group bacterium]
ASRTCPTKQNVIGRKVRTANPEPNVVQGESGTNESWQGAISGIKFMISSLRTNHEPCTRAKASGTWGPQKQVALNRMVQGDSEKV